MRQCSNGLPAVLAVAAGTWDLMACENIKMYEKQMRQRGEVEDSILSAIFLF
jgi:hypothetical protein